MYSMYSLSRHKREMGKIGLMRECKFKKSTILLHQQLKKEALR